MMKHLSISLLAVLLINGCAGAAGLVSYSEAESRIKTADQLISEGKIKEAHALVSGLRQQISEVTEMHAQIYDALKDDTKSEITANKERQITIEYAKLRDIANYQAGIISRKQNNDMEAIKHFVLVIQSQRTTGLGKQAYIQLREMGFSPTLKLEDQ